MNRPEVPLGASAPPAVEARELHKVFMGGDGRELKVLAGVDARKSQVVELRFFGGLTVEETAEVLKVSSDTVLRDWRLAKVWLLRELKGSNPDGS